MPKVAAGITMSLDGYYVGPNDGPGKGLGEGGERLHYWVFGGPWSYEEEPRGEATGADKEYLNAAREGLSEPRRSEEMRDQLVDERRLSLASPTELAIPHIHLVALRAHTGEPDDRRHALPEPRLAVRHPDDKRRSAPVVDPELTTV